MDRNLLPTKSAILQLFSLKTPLHTYKLKTQKGFVYVGFIYQHLPHWELKVRKMFGYFKIQLNMIFNSIWNIFMKIMFSHTKTLVRRVVLFYIFPNLFNVWLNRFLYLFLHLMYCNILFCLIRKLDVTQICSWKKKSTFKNLFR